jgi:four helix bundle protein
MYKSFKEMPVWQEAMSIAEEIFHITDSLPRKEDHGLTSQLRRSALSISANISEAFGRQHNKDKINFYSFARGSLTETQNHLEYAKRVGYIEEKVHQRIDEHLDVLHKDLNKIMLTLKSQSRSKP